MKGEEPVPVYSFEVTVVDTNGAGDTHSGVFLAELALARPSSNRPTRNAAAAMAISVLGPASCPERDVISSMIQHSP